MMSLSSGHSGRSLVMSTLRTSFWAIQPKAHWSVRLRGLMANKSFKPTPLRGAA